MPLVAIPLAVLLAGLALLALALTARTWGDAVARMIAAPRHSGVLGILTLPARLLVRAVEPGINYLAHRLSKAASHYMHPIAHWLDSVSLWSSSQLHELGELADATAYGIERTTTVVLPRAIGRATRPLDRRIGHLGKRLGALGIALELYRRGIDRLLRDRVLPGLRHLEHAVEHAIPRELARQRARTRALERRVTHPPRSWVKWLWRYGWVLVGAGTVTRYLVKRWPHLFCRNTTRVAKSLCSLDSGLIDLLLGEAFGVLLLSDLCRTEHLLELAADAFEPELRLLVTAGEDLLDHCGHDVGSAMGDGGYGGDWLASAT